MTKMDVLNPPLEEIDGLMYRMNLAKYSDNNSNSNNTEDEYEYAAVECEEPCDEIDSYSHKLNINELNGPDYYRFRVQFHVPKSLHGFLIGTKGMTRQRLEHETKTRILIPKRTEEGDLVVMGITKRDVTAAYLRVQVLVKSARRKIIPTHFLSIPTNVPNICERLKMFKNEVLKCCGDDQEIIRNDELFQSAEKCHLTLGVFTLLDERDRKIACNTLEECQKCIILPLIENQRIVIRLRGIDIMNDDPSQVRILYANVESKDGILQKLADQVVKLYSHDGLMKQEQRDHVKLHMTLMNTGFLEPQDEKSNAANRQRNRLTFDATKITKNLQDFDFGEVIVNSIHLSQRFVYSKDGYYLPSKIIKWT